MSELQHLYHELIIDHGRSPRNFGTLEHAKHLEGFNPLCGDRLVLYLKIDQDIIVDAKFTGQGCAISVASASLMTQALKGKTLAEAKTLFNAFHQMLTQKEINEECLGKLAILQGVAGFPARIKCAVLAWHTLNALLKGEQEPISTEQNHVHN
jgi:nitrogen fixation NifU-like protein